MPTSRKLPPSGLRPPFVLPHPLMLIGSLGLLALAWWDFQAGLVLPLMGAITPVIVFLAVAQRSARLRAKEQEQARASMLRAVAARRILALDEPSQPAPNR